jgi:hypothetical protein
LLSTDAGGNCSRCHAADDAPRELAERLARALGGARDRAERARTRLGSVEAAGLYVHGSEGALAELRTAELSVGPLVHVLDERALAPALARIGGAADAIEERIAAAERRKRVERQGYAVTAALLAILLALLVAKSVALARRRRG